MKILNTLVSDKKRALLYIIFVLSLIGFMVSGYLAYEYTQPNSIGCPIAGSGCDIVRNSEYAKFLGVLLPFWGVAYYLVIAFSSIIIIEDKKLLPFEFILVPFTFSGFAFSVYLTFLEAFVINAYCFWCVVSAIIATVLFGLALMQFIEHRKLIRALVN